MRGAGGERMAVADRSRDAPVQHVVHERGADHLHDGFLLRVVDVLAAPGAVAETQTGQDRERTHDAVVGIRERVLDRNGRPAGVAGQAVETRRAGEAEAVGAEILQRTGETGRRHREHDEVGLHGAEIVVAEVQTLHDAGTEVLDDGVATRHQVARQLLRPLAS